MIAGSCVERCATGTGHLVPLNHALCVPLRPCALSRVGVREGLASFGQRGPSILFRWAKVADLQAPLTAAFLSAFALRAQRPRAPHPIAKQAAFLAPARPLAAESPAQRAGGAKLFSRKQNGLQAALKYVPCSKEGRGGACRAACGTRRFSLKIDRARARSEQIREPAGCSGLLIRRRRER